ncbi:Predicted membrane protein [uncultured Clostridium sp.]|nr:Predicted membrane protein [uncultured Clostridium sp.]
MFSIGFIPLSVLDFIVTNLVSFWMGYQLCLFKKCLGVGYSTTICTGNIRTIGQFLYDALEEENKFYTIKLITFTVLTFSFALGAALGTLISISISVKSVWIPSIILLSQMIWIHTYDIIK